MTKLKLGLSLTIMIISDYDTKLKLGLSLNIMISSDNMTKLKLVFLVCLTVAFIFLPNKSARTGNVFMWVALFIGTGMLMCLYSMEWYARQTCVVHEVRMT